MIKPHIPDTLPLKNIDWERHVTLIGKANAALARYDGILLGMVNPTFRTLGFGFGIFVAIDFCH
jgi:hypothetical protein